eukprot:g45726.t1
MDAQKILTPPGPLREFGNDDPAKAWNQTVDEATGNVYYWNKVTKETTWTMPLEFKEKDKENNDPGAGAGSTSCDECEQSDARWTCEECGQLLCDACDTDVHNKGKRKLHTRERLQQAESSSGKEKATNKLSAGLKQQPGLDFEEGQDAVKRQSFAPESRASEGEASEHAQAENSDEPEEKPDDEAAEAMQQQQQLEEGQHQKEDRPASLVLGPNELLLQAAQSELQSPKAGEHSSAELPRSQSAISNQKEDIGPRRGKRVETEEQKKYTRAKVRDLLKKASQALETGSLSIALTRCNHAVNLLEDATTLTMRSGVYLRTRDYKQALADAQKAIRLNPNFAEAHTLAGQALMGLETYNVAYQYLCRAMEIDPKSDAYEVLKGLSRISEYTGPSAPPITQTSWQGLSDKQQNDLKQLLYAVDLLFRKKQYQEAWDMTEKALEVYDQDANIFCIRSEIKWGMEQYQEAATEARKAIRANKTCALAYCRLGQACVGMQNPSRAKIYLEEALQLDPQCRMADHLSVLVEVERVRRNSQTEYTLQGYLFKQGTETVEVDETGQSKRRSLMNTLSRAKTQVSRRWKRRFFTLNHELSSGRVFSYYVDKEDPKPIGQLPISQIEKICKLDTDPEGKTFEFSFLSNKKQYTFRLKALSASVADAWVTKLAAGRTRASTENNVHGGYGYGLGPAQLSRLDSLPSFNLTKHNLTHHEKTPDPLCQCFNYTKHNLIQHKQQLKGYRYEAKQIMYQGFLRKQQPGGLKRWQRRVFVLFDDALVYYKPNNEKQTSWSTLTVQSILDEEQAARWSSNKVNRAADNANNPSNAQPDTVSEQSEQQQQHGVEEALENDEPDNSADEEKRKESMHEGLTVMEHVPDLEMAGVVYLHQLSGVRVDHKHPQQCIFYVDTNKRTLKLSCNTLPERKLWVAHLERAWSEALKAPHLLPSEMIGEQDDEEEAEEEAQSASSEEQPVQQSALPAQHQQDQPATDNRAKETEELASFSPAFTRTRSRGIAATARPMHYSPALLPVERDQQLGEQQPGEGSRPSAASFAPLEGQSAPGNFSYTHRSSMLRHSESSFAPPGSLERQANAGSRSNPALLTRAVSYARISGNTPIQSAEDLTEEQRIEPFLKPRLTVLSAASTTPLAHADVSAEQPTADNTQPPPPPECDECEEAVAVWDCAECEQPLCASCDTDIHRTGKRKEHQRVALSASAS